MGKFAPLKKNRNLRLTRTNPPETPRTADASGRTVSGALLFLESDGVETFRADYRTVNLTVS